MRPPGRDFIPPRGRFFWPLLLPTDPQSQDEQVALDAVELRDPRQVRPSGEAVALEHVTLGVLCAKIKPSSVFRPSCGAAASARLNSDCATPLRRNSGAT
jgi:hypothetical protein